MSPSLISHSPDLAKLQKEGYELEIKSGYLVIHNVPYVNSKKEVKHGTLVSELCLAGEVTAKPHNHVALFGGEYPCDKNGQELSNIRHTSQRKVLIDGLTVDHDFSAKPPEGYRDYHHKMTTYVALISRHATAIDPNATARTCRLIESTDPESVFSYTETASSRAEITAATEKLELEKVGIIGLGGTGSYILDFVAKTPVKEIHLFDEDRFFQHNAFRSPGAPTKEELQELPLKVQHFKQLYSRMRKNIFAHEFFIDAQNVDYLQEMSFVFLCFDGGPDKLAVIEKLEQLNIPFIDVGMGLGLADDSLYGVLRVTTSTSSKRDHIRDKKRIPLSGAKIDDIYSKNIQVADLNALNATLAVIKWKKLFGFYADLENEHFCTYTLDGNIILNNDQA